MFLDKVRRHLVMLTSALTALVYVVLYPLGAPMTLRDAIVAVMAAGLGFVAMIGVAGADKLLPAGVGILKGALYLAVLLGAHGVWADPMFQNLLVSAVELGAGAIVAMLSTAVVPVTGSPAAVARNLVREPVRPDNL